MKTSIRFRLLKVAGWGGGGIGGGFEVILGKNNALEGGPSPKSNVGRKGVTLNISVLENNVEFT